MTQTRVYLPLTAADVRLLAEGGPVGTHGAYAVTAAVRAAQPSADEEECELTALNDAAASASSPPAGGRRVIAAADVDSALVDEVSGPDPETVSQVRLSGTVELRRIVSFHIEELPDAEDGDLLWYDVTELDEVVRLTS